jgi:hypothetical protein
MQAPTEPLRDEAAPAEVNADAQPAPIPVIPSPFEATSTLRSIAKPRLTGSIGAIGVTGALRERFEGLGYRVQDHDFTFNPWTGRFGLTIAGVILLIGSLVAAGTLYYAHPLISLITLGATLLLCLFVAFVLQRVLDRFGWGHVEGKNLLISKPGSRPHYLFMAHRDSKSQPMPLAFRGPAIVISIIAWCALAVLAIMTTVEPVPAKLIVAAGTFGVIAAVLLIFCWVENASPGALDNASGVTALIGVAERERDSADVAFLITDAEELGLAGARAIARQLPPVFGVINYDGIDDEGDFQIAEEFGWPRKMGKAPHLAAALLGAAAELELPARRRSVPFGILLDHIPIVKAGTPALTVMRGTLGSLRRVHRPIDDLEHMTGKGAADAVELSLRALHILRQRDADIPV